MDADALATAVRAEQVRVLYSMPGLIPVNLLNAALTAFVLRDSYPATLVWTWIGSFVVVVLARLLDWWQCRRDPSAKAPRVWAHRFAIGAILTGVLWGLAGSIVFIEADTRYHVFVAFVLGGMAAGAVLGDSAFLPALVGFVASATLPLLIGFSSRGDSMSLAMASMLAAFIAVLGIVGHRTNYWITTNARRQHLQAALTADLQSEMRVRKQAQVALVESNSILEAVALAATKVLRARDFDGSIPEVLELVGTSLRASRIQLFQDVGSTTGIPVGSHIWTAPGHAEQVEPDHLPQLATALDLAASAPASAGDEMCVLDVCQVEGALKQLLERHNVQSLVLVPIFADKRRWGALGVGDRALARRWSAVELDALRIVAELIGAAITHAHDLCEVADAGSIVENSSTILYRLDPDSPHATTYVSRNIARYGYSPAELATEPAGLMDLLHADDRPRALAGIAQIIARRTTEVTGEYRFRTAAGPYRWIENRTRAVYGDRRLVALEGILIDINDRKLAELEMARLMRTDLLTGLPNRAAFMERLREAFEAARGGGSPFSLLFLDLDRFKDINETLGHPMGDALLRAVAQRLASVLRDGDPISRVGGDEFVIFVSGRIDRGLITALATRVIRAITEPYLIGDSEIQVTGSVGISIFRAELTKPEDMMREADLALYEAKDSGRNRHVFHSEALDLTVRERVALLAQLRTALDRAELEVYYQPQIEMPSRRIIGLEALLRWNHPHRGLLTPGYFISVAEKSGMIGPIGQWIISEVRRQLRDWHNDGIAPRSVAVNLSAAQLVDPNEFRRDLLQGLAADALDPSSIELELTESVLMETTRGHREMINDLRATGVRIAIDDFGTGYSSLEYLLLYRVTRIKIAQQFVIGLPDDPRSTAIVRATIGLAREFGIEIIAEGVETAAQLDFLIRAGCNRIQGFYFSRPVPAAQATLLLQQGVIVPPAEGSQHASWVTSPSREEQECGPAAQ